MIYIIRKKINYQDFGNKRINTGLNYVEEKNIDTPKEYVLFGTECCKKFLEEDVFFDDKVGAYIECARRNMEIIDSFLKDLQEDWLKELLFYLPTLSSNQYWVVYSGERLRSSSFSWLNCYFII